jgi:hypothetical protein
MLQELVFQLIEDNTESRKLYGHQFYFNIVADSSGTIADEDKSKDIQCIPPLEKGQRVRIHNYYNDLPGETYETFEIVAIEHDLMIGPEISVFHKKMITIVYLKKIL